MTDVLDRMAERLALLMGKGYSGNVVITIKLFQGGVRQVCVNEEYPLELKPKRAKNKTLDNMQNL